MTTYSDSEIARLKRVIVHKPNDGIARISPKRAEELLFDDIVHLPTMRKEHQIFLDVVEAFVGKDNVLETSALLLEAMRHRSDLRDELITQAVDFEELPESYCEQLKQMDDEMLCEVLITGYHKASDWIYFDPIPNFIFTRDIAVTVRDHVIITKAAKAARSRENLLTRFIFVAHPMFEELATAGRLINLNNVELFPPSRYGETVSIEGGDVMMINRDFLLIGVSERTTGHAFDSIKNHLISHDVIKNVVRVNIPADRSFMHIDTLFTRIAKDDLVCFKPIVYDGQGSNVQVYDADGLRETYSSIGEFFLKEINPDMRFIFSGEGLSPYQEREQWTDSCNLVALKPGVGITYDRNHRTAKAFEQAGYKVIEAEILLQQIANGKSVDDIQNTIITIPSGELSRARGGSHCMTCPIWREKL